MANWLIRKKSKPHVSISFTKGMARSFDLYCEKEWPNLSNSTTKDYMALRSDWEIVGDTIRKEARNYGIVTRTIRREDTKFCTGAR